MGLNKQILKKLKEKTKDDPQMQQFIINILQEENKGIGWYSKFYKTEIDKAIEGDILNED